MDHDLIVIGQGVAGLTCAAEAAGLGLRVANFEGEFAGGLVANVNELQRFDEAEGASGMDYSLLLLKSNIKAGVTHLPAQASSIRAIEGGFAVESDEGALTARAVVLATGARLQKLGVPGEDEYEGRGVSHCADCDGPLFAGQVVVVAGGGDWALQDALLLARESAHVHIVFDAAEPSACAESRARAQAEPTIELHPGCTIERVLGDANGMTGVRLRSGDGTTVELASAGLFALPGLEANSAIAPAAARRDAGGALCVDDVCETDVPGLWAIGQVRAGFAGWLSDAVADARAVARAIKNRLG
ncbi:MAG: NAD(P)/FAD-dependent oxidoreductase [Pseudomonadota bacterium]|nr:NAD(P)/FAD-dependent oxidoreductase [Pseudomonadota bacterium]